MPTMMMTTLPFGRVATAPGPQIVEFCGEFVALLAECTLLGALVMVCVIDTVEILVLGGC